MKTKVIIVAIMMMTAANLTAQFYELLPKTKYGVKVNNFATQSGFGYQAGADLFVQYGGRTLEAGLVYEAKSNKITGIEVQHINLFKKNYLKSFTRNYKLNMFWNYNFIYRSNEVTALANSYSNKMITSKVSSIEHYAGLGLRLSVHKTFFIDGSVGIGGYLGSIKRTNNINKVEMFKIRGENSFSPSVKIGFGFHI